jgi:anti-sigma regulatory factor (Ser/Thr protein kinase)/CheY-like chemotaxis protein
MTSHPLPSLRIAYGDGTAERQEPLSATLRELGHAVSPCASVRECLASPEPDVYLIGRTLPDGTPGLELLDALRRFGRTAPVILVDERPDFADMRRAVELGASDWLLRPGERAEIVAALEKVARERVPGPQPDATAPAHVCERIYPCDIGTVGRAAREISAFLVNEGVVSAHRVRIASALAELVDNVCNYAYTQGSSGSVAVRAELDGARVRLSVRDRGRGFDSQRERLERIPAALPGLANPSRSAPASSGLGRVERLCEECRITSAADGTCIDLVFELTPVRFDEESEHLTDTEFLDPDRARALIAALRRGSPDLSGISPSLAVTIGRLIGGLSDDRRPRKRS